MTEFKTGQKVRVSVSYFSEDSWVYRDELTNEYTAQGFEQYTGQIGEVIEVALHEGDRWVEVKFSNGDEVVLDQMDVVIV